MTQGAGYSGTPLASKLGIREGSTVLTMGAPDGFTRLLDPIPDGVRIGNRYRSAEVVVVFARTEAQMRGGVERAMRAIPTNGAIWLCWPKKASGEVVPLQDRSVITDHCFPLGLVDVKIAAIDATWSGLKFVIRTELR